MSSKHVLAIVIATASLFAAGPAAATHPVTDQPYDHMTCFKMLDEGKVRARVRLDALREELRLDPACRVRGHGRLYCTPVRKDLLRLRYPDGSAMWPIEMPGHHQEDDRICYRVRCPSGPRVDSLVVEDQFGRRRIGELEERLLCTNAEIVRDTPTTTLPFEDPCALIDCADGHFCRPSCDSPKAAACVAFSGEGGPCGGFTPVCMEERCEPGLECLVPPDLPDALGVCVDPGNAECRDDEDCGEGEVCEPGGPDHPASRVCVPGCHTDDQCGADQICRPMVCVTTPCPGMCEDVLPGQCRSDEDCEPGHVCYPLPVLAPVEFRTCLPGCRDDEDCPQGESCVEVPCPGFPCPPQCTDIGRPPCETDDDCARGKVCEPTPDGTSVCVDGCHDDDDCGSAEHCSKVVCITSPCPGQCVPDLPCGPCTSDSECAPYQRCNAPDVCLQSCECPECDVCAGECVPDIFRECGECVSDNECPEGLRCNADVACKISCDCPLCAVCGGDCVPAVE